MPRPARSQGSGTESGGQESGDRSQPSANSGQGARPWACQFSSGGEMHLEAWRAILMARAFWSSLAAGNPAMFAWFGLNGFSGGKIGAGTTVKGPTAQADAAT